LDTVVTRDQFELLTQDSDVDSIKAAITAGADAMYCELNRFAYPDWYTVAISTNHIPTDKNSCRAADSFIQS